MDDFELKNQRHIREMMEDTEFRETSRRWLIHSQKHEYSYHFTWMGRPIIQYPQDMIAMQEIIWSVKPDLIVETGVARGGSVVYYASLLELIGGPGRVIGVDVEIRPSNRKAIDEHPMRKRITLIEGSSTDPATIEQVRAESTKCQHVLVALDSNHTHDHVLRELKAYSPLVTKDSYLVVFDTVIETVSEVSRPDRPWSPGNSPLSAVRAFLKQSNRFTIDQEIDARLQISVAPSGFLRCVRD